MNIEETQKNHNAFMNREETQKQYDTFISRYNEVFNVFKDFFGEDKVDLQGIAPFEKFYEFVSRVSSVMSRIEVDLFSDVFIIVHFPKVRITNEHDRYIDITHLWAKVKINANGNIKETFLLNRSEYPILHLRNDYMHSHVSNIPLSDPQRFQTPCTGNGPINHTISYLRDNYDLLKWQLFCLELSKYVTVESLAGIPYNKLENVTDCFEGTKNEFDSRFVLTSRVFDIKYDVFVRSLIKSNKLKFSYRDGAYTPGMSYVEFIMTISNEFIAWYNNAYNERRVHISMRDLMRSKVLLECSIKNCRICYRGYNDDVDRFREYQGKKVLTFKGKDVLLNIADLDSTTPVNYIHILNPEIALATLTTILNILNYKYGNNTESGTQTDIRFL